jgi:Family of unknown function (DUF5677)
VAAWRKLGHSQTGEVDWAVGAIPVADRGFLMGALVAIPTQYTIDATAATLATLATPTAPSTEAADKGSQNALDCPRTEAHDRGAPGSCPYAHWGILLALFASATTTYEAAVLLAREEFGYQAAMLNRSLFEVMVDCYWAAMNPTLAVERIKDHMSYNAHLKARVSAKYPDQFGGLAPPPALSDAEEKRLRKLYRRGGVSWTGLSLYDRVKAISERWPEGKAREHLMFFVDIANSINNEVLHPTPWGMSRTTRPRQPRTAVMLCASTWGKVLSSAARLYSAHSGLRAPWSG